MVIKMIRKNIDEREYLILFDFILIFNNVCYFYDQYINVNYMIVTYIRQIFNNKKNQ